MSSPAFSVPALQRLLGSTYVTTPAVLAARVATTPDAPFLLEAGQTFTFAQVAARAAAFAAYLDATGAARGRVAGFLSNRVEGIVAMLGTQLAGGTFVALNRPLRGQLLIDQLTRSRAVVLVTEAAAFNELPPIDHVPCLKSVICIDGEARQPPGATANAVVPWHEVLTTPPGPLAAVSFESTASLMFTSGTTGRSKGVLLSHAYLWRGAARIVEGFGLSESDVIHSWFPLSHLSGQMHGVAAALVSGATLAVFPTFSAKQLWSEVDQCGATLIGGFQSVARLLLAQRDAGPRRPPRLALMAGVTADEQDAFETRFHTRIVQTYGLTEAEPLTVSDAGCAEPPGSLGRASPDFDIAIVDELDRPVSVGAVGRIVARPRAPWSMMSGYDDDAAATADATRNLWLHTQDLGRLDADGYVYFVDRLKHAIRRRGENISSVELESIIATHPGVAQCAAIGIPAALGEHDVKLVVVPRAETRITPLELLQHCRALLPRFMVPRYYEIRDSVPLTEMGKIRRDSLGGIDSDVWDSQAATRAST